MKCFVGYSSKDRKLAGKVHSALKAIGAECFLAHENNDGITVAKKWVDEIQTHLDGCDIYIPIVTGAFLQSPFAQQEAGYAYSKEKTVVALCFGKDKKGKNRLPPAFLNVYQGHCLTATKLTTEGLATTLMSVMPNVVIDYRIRRIREI